MSFSQPFRFVPVWTFCRLMKTRACCLQMPSAGMVPLPFSSPQSQDLSPWSLSVLLFTLQRHQQEPCHFSIHHFLLKPGKWRNAFKYFKVSLTAFTLKGCWTCTSCSAFNTNWTAGNPVFKIIVYYYLVNHSSVQNQKVFLCILVLVSSHLFGFEGHEWGSVQLKAISHLVICLFNLNHCNIYTFCMP